MKSRRYLGVGAGVIGAVLAAGPGAVLGATWNGAGSTNNWSLAANWGGTAPLNNGSDNTHFAGTVRLAPNIDTPWSINSLTFDSGAGAFVIGGSALTVGTSVTNNSTNLETINAPLLLTSAQSTINAANGSLLIGGTGTTLSLAANSTLTVAGSFNTTISGVISGANASLVKTGTGTLTLNAALSNSFTGFVLVSSGTLDLNTPGFALQGASDLVIGDGNGAANSAIVTDEQNSELTNGANMSIGIDADGELNLKSFTDSTALLSMTGGSVIGTGTLNLTGTAAVTTFGSNLGSTTIAANLNLTGNVHEFTVNKGTLAIDLDISGLIVNGGILKAGAGTMRLSGANTFAGGLTLGGGTTLIGIDSVVSGTTIVSGAAGTGTLILGGGDAIGSDGTTHTVANTLSLQGTTTITGSHTLNFTGGMVIDFSDQLIIVSPAATANFSGNISGDLTGRGLNVEGGGALGVSGVNTFTGSFNIQGGNVSMTGGSTIPNLLIVDSEATFGVSAGTVTAASGIQIAGSSAGTMNQTGGTVTAPTLRMALNTNTGASYNLTGPGSLTVGTVTDGEVGSGAILQSAGNVSVTAGANVKGLDIAATAGSSGSYQLSGTGNLATQTEYIGDAGIGTFTQSGGTHTTMQMSLGYNSTGIGNYTLSGGNFTVGTASSPGVVVIGGSGTGTFTQAGGNFIFPASLGEVAVGANNSAASGFYAMSGTATLVTSILEVGGTGTGGFGAMLQSGGNATVQSLFLGMAPGSATATFGLSAPGNFTSTNIEGIGYLSAGTFTQSGGTHTLSQDMEIGVSAGVTGTYNFSGGAINSVGNMEVGEAGMGNFNQTGGAATFTEIYDGYNGVASMSQSAGTMNALILEVGAASANRVGTGSYVMTGGTLTVTGDMYLGYSSAGCFTMSGSAVLNGPNFPVVDNELFVGGKGTFTENGGNVTAYMYNAGIFIFNSGNFSGTLENDSAGTVTINGILSVAGGGIKNHGTMNVVGGEVGTAAGVTLSNDGTINLSAQGAIFSNGPVVNNGLITGTGFILGNQGFVNNAEVTQGAGTLTYDVLGQTGVSNAGTFTLASGRTFVLEQLLTNGGTFLVNGAVVTAGGGTLSNVAGGVVSGPGAIFSPFTNSGTVVPGAGTLNISLAWTNSGVVELGGLTSALIGGTITNIGTIQGVGTVGSGVTNTSGTVEAIGGTLVLSGAMSNATGGTLTVSAGNKILVTSGLATNAGLISLVGGTFDNGGLALNNTGAITGFGIFRSGGLTNNGNVTFSGTNGSTTTVNGGVTNDVGETINVEFNSTVFAGNVLNNGTIKTTFTTATFAGTLTNAAGSHYTSDPSTNIFQANVVSAGTMTGGSGDVYDFIGGTVNNSGNFTNGGTLESSDNVTNTGMFTQTGPQTWASGTVFTNNGGTATFGSDVGSVGASPLSVVVNAGSVSFASDEHLNSLNIQAGNVSVLSGVTKTSALVFGGSLNNWTGALDLTSAKLIVEDTANHAATLALVKNEVAFGRTHAAGVFSSVIPSNKTFVVSDNAVAHLTNFGGVNNVDAGSILETVAYKGDYNLDGVVDIQDLTTVANHWQGSVVDWSQGDFNGDGFVDIQDLTAVANNWQAGVSGGGGSGETFAEALAGLPGFGLGGMSSVPEPGTMGMVGLGGILMMRRRRR